MVVPDSPPHQKIVSTGPTVHTPKRAAFKIEQELDSSSHGKTGLKPEEPITVGPKRLRDSPFPKAKRKLAPTVLPFTDTGTKSKIESKAIVKLKKIDIDTGTDIEKRPVVNPKKLKEKGPETKVEIIEKLVGNPGKGPMKKAKETEKPNERPLTEVAASPPAQWSDPHQGPHLLVQ